jgi:hypothetical protein
LVIELSSWNMIFVKKKNSQLIRNLGFLFSL